MNIKKIKDDVFEKIGINKYEFFVSAMDYINDFPDIINEFYTDATETSSGEYLGFLINGGWNNEDETAVYISEYDYLNNVEIRVYFSYEEILQYFLMYYFNLSISSLLLFINADILSGESGLCDIEAIS